MQDYGILPPNDLYAPINEKILKNTPFGSIGLLAGQFTDQSVKEMCPDNFRNHRS